MVSVCTINGGTAEIYAAWLRGFAVTGQIAHHLAAAGGVPDVDGVVRVEVLDDRRQIIGVMIYVVAVTVLGGTTVPTPVGGDDPVTLWNSPLGKSP